MGMLSPQDEEAAGVHSVHDTIVDKAVKFLHLVP